MKPAYMTDEEWLKYQQEEDEWIYKMQKIALDAEEHQSRLKSQREQKRGDFLNRLKRKALDLKRREEVQSYKE